MPKLLTDLGIRKLKTPTTRREIIDSKVEGLALILQATGAKGWSYRYRYGRRQRRISLGTWPQVDLGKARDRAEAAKRALERGEDPGIALFTAKSTQYIATADRDAFGVVVRRFMADHAIPNTRRWRDVARLLGLKVIEREGAHPEFEDVPGRLVAKWAERSIGSITAREIIEVLDATKARAPIVANRELAALRKVFSWAVGKRIVESNPARGIPVPAKEIARDRVLSDDEIRLIWLAADGEGFPFGDIVKLLLVTAQRRLEVAGLLWAELDLRGKAWDLPSERTKNAIAHWVPLSDVALGILADVPRFPNAPYVFGHGGLTPFSGFSAAKKRIDDRMAELAAGDVKPWRLHDLRRTCATRLARLGVQPIVIDCLLNHISGVRGGVHGVYNVHAYEQERREALDAWARQVMRIVEPDSEASNVIALGAAQP